LEIKHKLVEAVASVEEEVHQSRLLPEVDCLEAGRLLLEAVEVDCLVVGVHQSRLLLEVGYLAVVEERHRSLLQEEDYLEVAVAHQSRLRAVAFSVEVPNHQLQPLEEVAVVSSAPSPVEHQLKPQQPQHSANQRNQLASTALKM